MPFQPSSSEVQQLRLLVDGELADAELTRAQQLVHAEGIAGENARAVIEGERNLQQAVGRVMAEAHAPASLRAMIAQSVADNGESAASASEVDDGVVGRIDRGGMARSARRATPLWWLFASPQRANLAAVAAVVALIGGAVLFGIFGRSIDDVPTSTPVDVVGNVAVFADKEHAICASDKDRVAAEVSWTTLAEAELGLTELLATPVRVFDLSAMGYEFVGAGECSAPLDQQPSGHLIYKKLVNGRPAGMVSVFVAPMRGCCKSVCKGMLPGEWQAADNKACSRRVLYSTDGTLLYFLVCCVEDDQVEVGRAITSVVTHRR